MQLSTVKHTHYCYTANMFAFLSNNNNNNNNNNNINNNNTSPSTSAYMQTANASIRAVAEMDVTCQAAKYR